MPNVANDLSQKLYATMEKHKEVSSHIDHKNYIEFSPCYLKKRQYFLKNDMIC